MFRRIRLSELRLTSSTFNTIRKYKSYNNCIDYHIAVSSYGNSYSIQVTNDTYIYVFYISSGFNINSNSVLEVRIHNSVNIKEYLIAPISTPNEAKHFIDSIVHPDDIPAVMNTPDFYPFYWEDHKESLTHLVKKLFRRFAAWLDESEKPYDS